MKRLFTALFILIFTSLSVNAEQKENILNAIQIDSLKDTYNITLSTDSEVNVKRTIQSSDNMILTLKNVKPAKSLNTVYKNAAEVDSIMVEAVGDNTLNIIIKAKNISNSAVNVEAQDVNSVSAKSVITPKKSKKSKKESIVLAAPINSYSPVYDNDIADEDLDESEFASLGLFAKIKNFLSQGNISNIITTGLIGLILFCGIKLFKKEEPETTVGLAQSLKDREMSLYRDLSMNKNLINDAEPVSNLSFSIPGKSVAPQITKPSVSLNSGYGLRAYKSSSRNPYMSADNTMLQRTLPKTNIEQNKPQPRVMSTVGSRVNASQLSINRPVQSMPSTATASNIDSMKFLESMTKIYEKNGRSDLAQGLKAGMLKAKSNI